MRVRTTLLLTASLLLPGLSACVKDTEEVAQSVGVLPGACGYDGARFEATVNGSSYCASAQVAAVGDGLSVSVTGVDLTGSTLILQADSIAVGTQDITEAGNSVLYMQGGNSYVVMPGTTGVLHITSADTTARVFKASFDVTLEHETSGQSRTVQGSVDVVYTEQE